MHEEGIAREVECAVGVGSEDRGVEKGEWARGRAQLTLKGIKSVTCH